MIHDCLVHAEQAVGDAMSLNTQELLLTDNGDQLRALGSARDPAQDLQGVGLARTGRLDLLPEHRASTQPDAAVDVDPGEYVPYVTPRHTTQDSASSAVSIVMLSNHM